jgi:hypothetical protein
MLDTFPKIGLQAERARRQPSQHIPHIDVRPLVVWPLLHHVLTTFEFEPPSFFLFKVTFGFFFEV